MPSVGQGKESPTGNGFVFGEPIPGHGLVSGRLPVRAGPRDSFERSTAERRTGTRVHVLGPDRILAQDPLFVPDSVARSPAPRCHTTRPELRKNTSRPTANSSTDSVPRSPASSSKTLRQNMIPEACRNTDSQGWDHSPRRGCRKRLVRTCERLGARNVLPEHPVIHLPRRERGRAGGLRPARTRIAGRERLAVGETRRPQRVPGPPTRQRLKGPAS